MDWLKNLKVGSYVCLYGGIYSRTATITGETNLHWKVGHVMFRKDNGRIRGECCQFVFEAKPEAIADGKLRKKRRKAAEFIQSADESDLDAVIAIWERAGK